MIDGNGHWEARGHRGSTGRAGGRGHRRHRVMVVGADLRAPAASYPPAARSRDRAAHPDPAGRGRRAGRGAEDLTPAPRRDRRRRWWCRPRAGARWRTVISRPGGTAGLKPVPGRRTASQPWLLRAVVAEAYELATSLWTQETMPHPAPTTAQALPVLDVTWLLTTASSRLTSRSCSASARCCASA
ncbi:hypothetical protein HBB16_18125 [Pseudonocardia sp. MCCB 268]|nr:hypothetical protein [Pseudonocardia cytotoxica]